jgi:SPP1 family predicted phage head-tail adaptor
MTIRAGDMWARVTIQQPSPTANEVGEPLLTWSTFATVWADVQPLSARETERYAEAVGFMSHKVRIRYLNGLTSAMRIVYRNRVLEIGQITEQDRLWHQDIICTEKRDASFVPTVPAAPLITGARDIDHIQWTTPSDGGSALTGYRLYKNGVLVEPDDINAPWTQSSSDLYAIGSVMQVRAVNAVGDGPLSDPVTVS